MATWPIHWRLKDAGGTLLEPDSAPVLSDATGSYGVWNTSTSNVIVADGTAMTKVADGHYKYVLTFADAEAADKVTYGTTYTYSIEFVYSGNTYFTQVVHTTQTSAAAGSNLDTVYEDYTALVAGRFPELSGSEAAIIQRGYLRFIYPPPVEITRGRVIPGYVWSFLSPATTLTTAASTATVAAPDDFGGLVGQQMFIDSTNYYPAIHVVGSPTIEAMHLGSDSAGYPAYVCTEALAFTSTTGQRYQFRFAPVPDAEYTVRYRYNVNPDAIAAGQFAHGGVQHRLSLEYAILAVAEEQSGGGIRGAYHADFIESLKSSIAQDLNFRNRNRGYNSDSSGTRAAWPRLQNSFTYNGVPIT
jgi:hypothetical protein